MLKLTSFLCLLAVALAVASSFEVAPESEVDPVAEMEPETASAPWIDFDSEVGAVNENEEASGDDDLQSDSDPESEEAEGTGMFRCGGHKEVDASRCGGHKIRGGYQADISDHPYQVSVEQFPGFHSCGGSIISPQWVLTACHCARGDPSLYRVRAGSNYYGKGGTRYSVSKIHRHSGYNMQDRDYDIAVMRIEGTFKYGALVQLVRLTNCMPRPGTPAIVSGWGHTSHNGLFSEHLLAVSLTVTPQRVCEETFQQINERKFCAGYLPGGRGACGGDSGSPLVSGGVQVGIAIGARCDLPKSPTIFTNVAYFRKWIRSFTGV